MHARLQHEIKKKQPFDLPEQEAVLNVARTADRMQLQFTRLFRGHGLTSSQYNVLRILRGEGGPLPILEVAARTITVVPAITGLMDRLEEAGLVLRQRSVTDRRVILVNATPKALEILAGLDGPLLELHQTLLGHMSAEELTQLSTLLEKARAGIPSEETNS